MRQFEIKVKNKIGALAEICGIFHSAGINLKAISSEHKGDHGIFKVITDNDDLTRDVLKECDILFGEYEIVPVRLLDKPGELAKVAHAMSNLGIDIESVFLMDREKGAAHIAFKVNDLKKAKELLK